MKTALLFSTGVACGLLALCSSAAADVAADWNVELDAIQQTSHQTASGRTRANAIMRAVLAETTNGIEADRQSGRSAEPVPGGANVEVAAAQAAYSALAVLYPKNTSALDAQLANSLAAIDASASAIAAGKDWGKHVAEVVLADQGDAVLLNSYSFAEEAKPLAAASTTVLTHASPLAEQTTIGPGRYQFSVLAGAPGTDGYVDDTGAAARFHNPGGMAVDALGNVYVSDPSLSVIRKVSPQGVVTTFAGTAGQSGSQDGAGIAARFNQPSGLAVDGTGNVYVADTSNNTIRKIDPAGNVTLFAGKTGEPSNVDGVRDVARLYSPASVAVDGAGNVFFAEFHADFSREHPIRKVAPDGTVSTLTVLAGSDIRPLGVEQICVDWAGNLYVLYLHSGPFEDVASVAKLTPGTEAGKYTASVVEPPDNEYHIATGIGLDGTGSLVITSGNYGSVESPRCTVLSPEGTWQARYEAGGRTDFDESEFVAVGQSGDLYVFRTAAGYGDQFGELEVGRFDPAATGPVILQQPIVKTGTSIGDAGDAYRGDLVSIDALAAGGPELTYQWYLNSGPIAGATSASLVLRNVQTGDSGNYSVVVADSGGSITSRKVKLAVTEPPPSSGGSTGASTGSSGSGSTTSSGGGSAGGGSFDGEISLAVLVLLAAALSRRRVHRNFRCTRMLSILLPSRIVVSRNGDE